MQVKRRLAYHTGSAYEVLSNERKPVSTIAMPCVGTNIYRIYPESPKVAPDWGMSSYPKDI
jgi:O-acetyl-ADP-ribose deacetylase (regulator of RNase III)